ncbi:MAG: transposase [Clostridiaceae bacterium]|nr:transposase [Clostridiaceae bacterium]
MPREARKKSRSGIYHVLLRGKDMQAIFHDEEDHARFLDTLYSCREKTGIEVYGWCLLFNHAHLLIKEGRESLSGTIKRLAVSYAWHRRSKYKTEGSVFHDRFGSEAVEQGSYLLTLIRFIHQNPVKAGLIDYPGKWKWSSCRPYYGFPGYPEGLLDEALILSMFDGDTDLARRLFIQFNEQASDDWCMDVTRPGRLSDEEALRAIEQAISGYEISQVKHLPVSERNALLRKIKAIEGVSLRQAARIIGVSHVLIHRA